MLIFNISGNLAGTFAIAAGVGALFFFGEVPRVRRDILQKVPFLDTYFDRSIPPEDNVSWGAPSILLMTYMLTFLGLALLSCLLRYLVLE